MKTRYAILLLALPVFLYAACEKKESTSPAIIPAVDSTKKADTAKQASVYPYIVKYAGWLNDYFHAPVDPWADGYGIDSYFIFYVEYYSKDTMSIWDSGYVAENGIEWTPGIVIQSGVISGYGFIAGEINGNNTFANGTILLANDSLYIYCSYPEYVAGSDPATVADTFRGKIIKMR